MSCYFRHLKDIFDEAGIEVTSINRKQIDQLIHQIVGTDYKDCSGTWQGLKQQIITDGQKRQDFIVRLMNAIKQEVICFYCLTAHNFLRTSRIILSISPLSFSRLLIIHYMMFILQLFFGIVTIRHLINPLSDYRKSPMLLQQQLLR